MINFAEWLADRDITTFLRLLESADYFNAQAYNVAFDKELDGLDRLRDPAAREQVEAMRGFDWAGYISAALQRSGFRGNDIEEHLHDLVVKLLVRPGKLLRGWDPTRHGPLERRFRRSVRNGIINIAQKARNHRKWMTATDPVALAASLPSRPVHSGVLEAFRQLIARRLGALATTILDWRVGGREIRDLVGNPEFGSPTAYMVKREVQAIKTLAQQFATESDDPTFIAKMRHAMNASAKTAAKRQQSIVARRAD